MMENPTARERTALARWSGAACVVAPYGFAAGFAMAQGEDPFAKASQLATSATDAIVPIVAAVAILVVVICGIVMMIRGRLQLGLLAGAAFGLLVALLARPLVDWVQTTLGSS